MELSRSGSNCVNVNGKNWALRFGEPERDRFTLQCAEDLFLVSGLCSINGLSEQMALPSRLRPHVSEDEKEYTFDSKTVIPFGSEPSVIRKYKLTENILHLTTDLVMRITPGMTELSAGDFQIRGNIEKVMILEKNGDFREVDGIVLYDKDEPPLSVLFYSANGGILEISTGEDVWRWNGAKKMGASSRFRIERDYIGIRYYRDLFSWDKTKDEPPPPGRVWRFNTMIAWKNGKTSGFRRPSGPVSVFDCAAAKKNAGGILKDSGDLCFSANGTVNLLKKWIRNNLSNLKKGDTLLLDNVNIGPCHCASHQDRPGKKELLHWDLRPLLEFKRWAEKQLSRSGAVLKIIPEKNSPIREFPSILAK